MDQRIADEGPDVRQPATRPLDVGQHTRIETRGNEGKQQQSCCRLLRIERQHQESVDEHENAQQPQHDRGHVEHSFAVRLIEHKASVEVR